MFRIDQTGLSAGQLGKSRTDGLATGATVTLTYVGYGSFRPRLLWVPIGASSAPLTLTEVSAGVWQFSPVAGAYGTYRIEGIENEGKSNERRVVRVFVVRTPSGLIIPAFGERANALANLANASATTIDQSENNATDFADTSQNLVPWAGTARATHEWVTRLDALTSGPVSSADVSGTLAPISKITPPPHAVVTGGNLALNGDELNRLISGLVGVLGSKMPDAFFGEALVNLGTLDTTWPSSIGRIYPLTHTGSGPFYKIHFDPITRRKCIADTVGSQSCSLRSLIPLAIKAFLIVFRSYGLPPGPAVIATPTVSGHLMMSQQEGTMLLRNEVAYGSPTHYVDGVQTREMNRFHVLYAEDPAVTGTAGFCIAGTLSNYSMFGELYAAIPLTDTLTATELANSTTLMQKFYGIRKNDMIIIDGTSIPYGAVEDTGGGSAGQFKWHPLVTSRLCGVYNAAHAGWTLDQIEAQLPTLLAARPISAYRRVVYFVDGDTNSLRSDHWSGQQCADANWRIAALARAAGCKVVLSSTLPYDAITNPPPNAIKGAQWQDHADAYCDLFNAGVTLNAYLHPTKDGYMKYAAAVRASVWPLLA